MGQSATGGVVRVELPDQFVEGVTKGLRNQIQAPKRGKDWVTFFNELVDIALPTYVERHKPKLRPGEYSPCGKFRFYQYQSYVRKRDGLRSEYWVPAEEYEERRRRDYEAKVLNEARREFNQIQKEKRK
jgi:hypothetical protein